MSDEENIVLERYYTIPLWKSHLASGKRRAPKAINIIKEFVNKHMKSKEIVIDTELNEKIWSKGIENPPNRIIVRTTKDEEGIVKIYLAKGD